MFAYCLNNPVNSQDSTGSIAIADDALELLALLVVGVGMFFAVQNAIVETYQTLSDWCRTTSFVASAYCEAWATTPVEALGLPDDPIEITPWLEQLPAITAAQEKGKQNIRDTGLRKLSDEEIHDLARNRSIPKKDRQRYIKEDKARKNRNKAKREDLY